MTHFYNNKKLMVGLMVGFLTRVGLFSQSLYVSNGETVFVSSGTTFYAGSGSIEVATGGTLSFDGTIHSEGSISNAGTLSGASSGTLYLAGGSVASNTNQTINAGGGTVRYLTVNEGNQIQLTGTLNIPGGSNFGKVTVIMGGKLNANGYLVLKSNANGSAIVSQGYIIGGNNYLSNDVIVERYIPARRAYRLISPSATTTSSIYSNWQESGSNSAGLGTHITGGSGNGFDATQTNNPSVFSFNKGTSSALDGTWSALTNTNSNTLSAGNPLRLMVRGDRTISLSSNTSTPTVTVLRTTGQVGQGDITFSSANGQLSNVSNGFSLIGNPYPAPVDMKSLLTNASNNTNVSSTYFYVWDPQINTRGAYVTVTTATGSNAVGSNQTGILQPGQAAFVKTASNGSASLIFTEAIKADASNNGNGFKTLPPKSILNLKLFQRDSLARQAPACDALEFLFDPSFSDSLDNNDAIKPINQDENLSVFCEGKFCSVEQRNIPEISDIIDLRTSQFRSSLYTLRAYFTGDLELPTFLWDRFNNTVYPLKSEGETLIDFEVVSSNPASFANQRFALIFQNTTAFIHKTPPLNSSISIYPNPVKDGWLEISSTYEVKKASLWDVTGKEIANWKVGLNRRFELPQGIAKGIYLLEIETEFWGFTQSLIIEH